MRAKYGKWLAIGVALAVYILVTPIMSDLAYKYFYKSKVEETVLEVLKQEGYQP